MEKYKNGRFAGEDFVEFKVRDKQTGKFEKVIDKTENSFNVTRTKLTEDGINCTQWFTVGDFYKKFEIK